MKQLAVALAVVFALGCAKKPAPAPEARRKAGAACESSEQCVCWACECEGGEKGAASACSEGKCEAGAAACEDVCADRNKKVVKVTEDPTRCAERRR